MTKGVPLGLMKLAILLIFYIFVQMQLSHNPNPKTQILNLIAAINPNPTALFAALFPCERYPLNCIVTNIYALIFRISPALP